jgi:pilus assembly protein Flp/PilA
VIRKFIFDESGATAIEYALVASLISIAILISAGMLGNNLSFKYNDVASRM